MTRANLLTIDDLISELDMGKATVKFILSRFNHLLNCERINGDDLYSPSSIPILMRIRDLLDSGMLPSQIEEFLEKESSTQKDPPSQSRDIRMNQDAVEFIQDLFKDIRGHQDRIAQAHEKRAKAEERKAVAIEKRAEAEEKKAVAMNNIAMALQEMNMQRSVDSQAMEIAGQAAKALTLNDSGDYDQANLDPDPLVNLSDPISSDVQDVEDLLEDPVPVETDIDATDINGFRDSEDQNLDDLSMLVDDEGLAQEDIDDLSELIDTVSDAGSNGDDLSTLLDEEIPIPDLDDLSVLLDEPPIELDSAKELDDLYSLVDMPSDQADQTIDSDLDDLSQLLDHGPGTDNTSEDMDDLSALVEDIGQSDTSETSSMDNLSLLVEEPAVAAPSKEETESKGQDDLWALVDDNSSDEPMDDLYTLVDSNDTEDDQPSLKPDISPEQDLAKYKAAVMKIIIDLKNQGFNAQETTDRFNKDGVATLSGKPQWGVKAIEKIYGFIDSAK